MADKKYHYLWASWFPKWIGLEFKRARLDKVQVVWMLFLGFWTCVKLRGEKHND